MILTDDNFATIVKAVELGRGLYDNLTKYIRFQMGVLAGMILAFLGASIFNIVAGVIFLPLQTLWVNFTTQVFQSVGLGYGQFADDVMDRQPRKEDEPILNRPRFVWIAISGLVMAGITVGIAKWADDNHGHAVARTMALTTFALANLVFSFTALDEKQSVFSLDVISDRKFLMFSSFSLAAIFLGTELGPLNRILQTVPLSRGEWGVCLVLPLIVVAASELWKLYLRHREATNGG
jgi:Ca2+-transporting ATPase